VKKTGLGKKFKRHGETATEGKISGAKDRKNNCKIYAVAKKTRILPAAWFTGLEGGGEGSGGVASLQRESKQHL